MLNSKSEKRLNERLKTLHGRKKKYERLLSNPIKPKEQYEPDSTQQDRYKTLVENIPCVVYSAYPGKTGPTTFMSEKWKDWTGYSPEELYRDPEAWPKCIHPDDREMAVEAYSSACKDNTPYNLEYRIVHKNTGQVRIVRDQGLLNKDERDNIVRVDGIITDISELKQAEKSQRDSEERFRNFLDSLGDIAYETDASGNLTYVNKMAETVTGIPLNDIVGKPFLPLFTKESQLTAIDVYKRTLNGEEAEYELTFTNGRICHFKNEPLRDENGKITGVFGIARDITERKQVERELRASEERFRTMLESLPNVAVQGYGPDGTIHYWNKANESIYDYTTEEAIGKDLVELIIPPEMRSEVREVIAHGARTGEMPPAAELNLMRKDGSRVPVWSSHVVIRHVDKKPELFCIDVDLSELKRTEKALRESEERCENLFNNALLGLYRTTPDGRILMANPALVRMLGYNSIEELSLRDLEGEGFEPQYFRSEFKERVDTSGSVIGLEADWIRHDGATLSIRESARAIRDEKGNVLYYEGTVEDISERKRAEQELRKHRDHLEEMVATRTQELERSNETLLVEIKERRQAEEALRESESSYRAVVENAAEGIVVVQDQMLQFVNPAMLSMTGFSEKELLTRPFINFIHPEHKELAMGIHIKRLKGEEIPPSYELKVFDKKGNTLWLENNGISIEWRGKLATLNFLRDVTERKKAEQAIWASESEKRSILNAISDHIIFHDADLTIRWCNEAATRSIGVNQQEIVGSHCYELWQGRNVPCEGCPVLRAMEIGSHNAGIITTPDGKWWEIVGEPVLDREGNIRGAIEISRDITERKNTEQALRESEEKFRSLAEFSPNMIFINSKGKVVYANKKCEEVMGYKREEFYSDDFNFRALIAPESLNLVIDNFARHLRGEDVQPYDYTIIAKNGNRIEAINSSKLIQYEGQPAVLGVVTDITERKRVEEALQESEEQFRAIFDTANDAIFLHEIETGRIIDVNRKMCEMFGYAPDEARLVSVENLSAGESPYDQENAISLIRKASAGETQLFEWRARDKKGRLFWVEVNLKRAAVGKNDRILAIVRDITSRKEAEEALKESEERLKILFESAPDAMYLIDSEGRFVDANRAAFELAGFTREEAIGNSLAEMDLLSAEQLSKAIANLKKVTGKKLSGPNEYYLKRRDGSYVTIEVRTFPVKIGGKVLSLGIARDITEHKHTEQKLLEHQAELKSLASQLSLTEERERHRLATDLHDQIGQSLVISKIKLDQLRKSSGSDEFNKSLEDISQCLGQIIDDTRALTFDLSYPILYELGFEAAVAEWLADQIQEKHGIRTEFVDDGHNKPLDDDICVLLFRNVRELLINVVKHAQADKVRVSVRRIKNNICISVEDDGIGFDPVEAVSLATQRAKYGLFSIRERLEQLGGQIEIDSRMGGGSRIIMKAPLKK